MRRKTGRRSERMISVQNLTKMYTKDNAAVSDVDFKVGEGEIVALLGPSGCGKTTILRCIAGFEQPTTGEIYIDNHLVSNGEKGLLTPVENRGLGFVHQSYALWPHRTVYKNVAYPLELRKRSRKEIDEKVRKTLHIVRLESYADRFPSELSGGEQQRVALARSLVYDPSAILLDEPLSNLDAKLREQTRFELRRIFKELHISALYVTHDQSEALAIADRCIVMEKGRIQQIGTPIELYTQPSCAFVADFMGSSNIFRGTVNTVDPQDIDVQWATLQYTCPVSFDGGKDIMVCIRPKDISLDHNDRQKDNTFQAKITVKTFAGDFYKFLVTPLKRPDLEILVHVYDYEKAVNMAEGETVYISFPAPFCRLIPI
jgi:iron(III) transport system ATP-binding protein